MKIHIQPSRLEGALCVPPSKSMGHRALICAGLTQGSSTILGLGHSKDMEATIQCLEALGASFKKEKETWHVVGCDPRSLNRPAQLKCNESGSTLRFLLPVACLSKETITLYGKGRLMERPMKIYQDLFEAQGLRYSQTNEAIKAQGPLQSGNFTLPGNVSSQFISGLLFALPLMEKESTLHIQGKLESKSYIDLTLDTLEKANIKITPIENGYSIEGHQTYAPTTYHVEKDYSQLAFFAVYAALKAPLSFIELDPDSKQGDKAILKILEKAGASIEWKERTLTIKPSQLHEQVIDLADCPDLGPILCVLAAYCPGQTKIIHAGRLRIKESDRIQAMENELKKWGVDIQSDEDTITINGKRNYKKEEIITMEGHNDHRIVMACTIFGLLALSPSCISGAEAIEKSYPTFFEDIKQLKGKVELV